MSIEKTVMELGCVNAEIKRLMAKKEALVAEVVEYTQYDYSGQKTYDNLCSVADVVIKSSTTYKVDEKEYEIYKGLLASCLNPVEVVPSYKVKAAAYKDCLSHCSEHERELLEKMVDQRVGKASVSIVYK